MNCQCADVVRGLMLPIVSEPTQYRHVARRLSERKLFAARVIRPVGGREEIIEMAQFYDSA